MESTLMSCSRCRRGIEFMLSLMMAAALPTAMLAEGMQYPLSVASDGERIIVADRHLPGVWKIAEGKAGILFRASKQFRTPLNAVRCVAFDKQGKPLAGDSATRDVYRIDDVGQPQPLSGGDVGIPMSIAMHSNGDLYVADLELHRIVRVPANGGKAEPFVQVPAPRGVAFDRQDRLWIVSHGPDQVLRADGDGKLETVVEGKPFQFPHTVVVDAGDTAYVADGYGKTIWRIEPPQRGTKARAAAPEKWVSGEPLVNPVGLALHGKELLVADPRANAIFRIGPDAKLAPLEFVFE